MKESHITPQGVALLRKAGKIIFNLFFLFSICTGMVSCTIGMKMNPTMQTPDASSEVNELELTDIIEKIINQSGWVGQTVTIVGYYRGWDLSKEAQHGPPVTRSDWVIKDTHGAIYVFQNAVEIEGQENLSEGERLNPGDPQTTDHILRVTGVVRFTQDKYPYIEAINIDLLK